MKWTYYFSTGVITGKTNSGVQIHAVPTAKHSLYVTSDSAVASFLAHHKDAVLVNFEGGASPSALSTQERIK